MTLERLTQITSVGITSGITLNSATLTGSTVITAVSNGVFSGVLTARNTIDAQGSVTVGAGISAIGIITASSFIGDGSGLTGVTATGSGIVVKDNGSLVGVAATIDFGVNLNLSPAFAGIVTVTVGDTDLEIVDKIVHADNTTTAIRFPENNTVSVETAGAEALRINSSQNVGIGTTNPGAQIHVVPGASSIAGLFSGTTSSDMVRITQLGTGNALVVEDESNPDASSFVVSASGEVGIGTANPTDKFNISSSGPSIRLIDTDDGSYGRLRYNRTASLASLILEADALNQNPNVTDISFRVGGVTSDDEKASISSSKFIVGLGGTVLTANLSGSVGIGTTNPTVKLEVYDTVAQVGFSTRINNASSNLVITNTAGDAYLNLLNDNRTTGPVANNGAFIGFNGKWSNATPTSNRTFGAIGAFKENGTAENQSGYLALYSRPSSGATLEAIRIDSSQRVGIGTTNPTSNLHVVGNARVTGVITATTFSGNLSGGVNLAAGSGTANYITFAAGATGNQNLLTDSGLTYNASTNLLGASISGNAATATAASTVTLTAGSDTTSFIVFSGTATGNIALNTDTGLTYNPSTNILGATISGSAASWTTGRTISLTGDVTGTSAAFNGTANLSFATTLASAVVSAANLDGGQSGSAPILAARAFVHFVGTGAVGGQTIRADGNVSSVSKTSSGNYTVNFTTALSTYSTVVCTCSHALFASIKTISTTSCTVASSVPTVSDSDAAIYSFVAFR